MPCNPSAFQALYPLVRSVNPFYWILGVEELSGKTRCLAIFLCTSRVLEVPRTGVLPTDIHLRFQIQNNTWNFFILSVSAAAVTEILLHMKPTYDCRRNRDVYSRHTEAYYTISFPLVTGLFKDMINNTFCICKSKTSWLSNRNCFGIMAVVV
jgi:hypothetical protein